MARKIEALSVLVDGDISGLKRAMNEAVQTLNSTERAIKNLDKAAEYNPNDINILKDQLTTYQKALVEQRKALRELEADQRKIWKDPNFKRGVTEYTERYSELTKQISKVKAEEEKLNKGIEETQRRISNFTFDQKFRKISEEIGKTKKSLDGIQSSVENVSKAIDLNPDNIDLYREKQSLLKTELEKVNEQLANLEKEKKLLSSPLFHKVTEEETKRLAENALETEKLIKRKQELRNEMKSEYVDRFNHKMADLGKTLQGISESTRGLSRAFRVLLTGAFQSAKTYESDIANIRRVVSDLTDKTIDDLKELAIQTGTTFSDISQYATIAGALGLSEQEISKFAETMTDLNTATGGVFSGEEGAKGIAVFLKQLNLGIDQAENFGSAIAVIGDKYADIGDETVNVATRLTALTSLVKTNQYELIGLAGVMADLGLSTDSNANAINRAFLQIEKAIATDEDKLKVLADTAGMTSKQFVRAWKTDAMDAFLSFTDGLKSSVFNDINKAIAKSDKEVQKFADVLGWSAEMFKERWGTDSKNVFNQYVDALGEMSEDSESASVVLKELGISSVNTAQTLLRLSGSGNAVREAIELTNQAWNENTALTEKSDIIYDTTERKLQGFYESLKQVGGALVDTVLPSIKELLDDGVALANRFKTMSPHLQKLTLAFVALGAGISPVTKHLGNLLSFFFDKNIFTGLTKSESLIKNLGTVLNSPFGLVAGMTTLVGIVYELSNVYAENDPFCQMKRGLEELGTSFEETSRIANENFLASLENMDIKSTEYLEELDALAKVYNNKKLPWNTRQEALEKISEYIGELNASMGAEIFYWDSTSNSIKSHTGEIESTKQAYEEYINEIKRQNWLDAHAEEYNQAKQGFEQVENNMVESTRQFYENVSNIPKDYMDLLLEAAKGTDDIAEVFSNFDTLVQEKGLNPLTDGQIMNLRNSYEEWSILMEEAEGQLNGFKTAIDEYTSVENSTAEDFQAVVEAIEQSHQKTAEYTDKIIENGPTLTEIRDLMATRVEDENSALGELIDKLDDEKTKTENLNGVFSTTADTMGTVYDATKNEIDLWENWTPSPKEASFKINLVGSGSSYVGGGSSGYSLPFDMTQSGGYGDFGNILNAINRAMNNIHSGGVGVTVNANFYAGSSTMNNYTARQFARTFGEELNNYLGALI